MGPIARRGLQLLGGVVDFGGLGDSISAQDVAASAAAALLQVDMVDLGRVSSLARRAAIKSHPHLRDPRGYRSHRHSLAVRSLKLRQDARGSMEVAGGRDE